MNISLLRAWVPLAIVTTCLSGLVYVTVQQDLRQTANDPQIELSEDIATYIAASGDPSGTVPSQPIDMATSLAPFVNIYAADGSLIAGNGQVNGQVPQLAQGVLDYTKANTQDRITWEPADGVRSALVVTKYGDGDNLGYVAVGRSLREVEAREMQLTQMVALGWAVTLLAGGLGLAAADKLTKPKV